MLKNVLLFVALTAATAFAQPAPTPTPVPAPSTTDRMPPDEVRQLPDDQLDQVRGPAATEIDLSQLRKQSQAAYNAWRRLPKTAIRQPVQPPAILRR